MPVENNSFFSNIQQLGITEDQINAVKQKKPLPSELAGPTLGQEEILKQILLADALQQQGIGVPTSQTDLQASLPEASGRAGQRFFPGQKLGAFIFPPSVSPVASRGEELGIGATQVLGNIMAQRKKKAESDALLQALGLSPADVGIINRGDDGG